MSAKFEDILSLGRNESNFKKLSQQLNNPNRIIPFVGSGMSVPLGLPSWRTFLLKIAKDISEEDYIKNLLDDGEYEESASYLEDKLKNAEFMDAMEDAFDKNFEGIQLDCAAALLPKLAEGVIITTNYDKLLEEIYKRSANPFIGEAMGTQMGRIGGAINKDEHYIIKVHGDITEYTSWILTSEQYQQYYGVNKIDYKLPIPKMLKRILEGRTLLFLGCSLVNDRIVKIIDDIAKEYPDIRHYAVVEKSLIYDEFLKRKSFLSDHNIRPIWYPQGQYEYVKIILQELISKDFKKKVVQFPNTQMFR